MNQLIQKKIDWMKNRLRRIPEYDRRLGLYFLISFWVATNGVAIVLALGHPTGSSLLAHLLNIVKAVGLNSLGFLFGTFILACLLSFLYLPIPRLNVASLLYTGILSVCALIANKSGVFFSYIVGIGYSLLALCLGLLLMIFVKIKKRRLFIISISFVGLCVGGYFLVSHPSSQPTTSQVIEYSSDSNYPENPGELGDYDVTFFTYGSGTDLHRDEFAAEVDEITPTVDASSWVTGWDEKREKFWGFAPSDLPLNGRVWLPEGEGPFPVVLIVHGNHTMEYFSTAGYDYLGKQLASRGFVTISVDEDYINYSNQLGIPDDNYTLRSWVLLQHLSQLDDMNQLPESHLHDKLDLKRVGLIGHSRGGQAVSMAADYETFFPDDEALKNEMDSINIQAVATLAPTDKTINGEKPYLHNTSYLTLQGAKDTDINGFPGNRQFYRSTFDEDDDGFVASLYIEGANHAQFNSNWGQMDLSLPRGLFLNQREIMEASEQRKIAKVYLSAYFERVFHKEKSYEKLFTNHYVGQDWLPDTMLISKYRGATYQPIEQFERMDSVGLELEGFTHSEVTQPAEKGGTKHLEKSLLLEWKKNASLTLELSNESLHTIRELQPKHMIFTMANLNDEEETSAPEVNIEMSTSDGESVRLPLDDVLPFPPVIHTHHTLFGQFDDSFRNGKYDTSWEPIFQTFYVPLDAFEKNNSAFDAGEIGQITLHFNHHPGKVYVEEIGVQ